ncbi:hypothetical protein LX36DRAFT_14896 [Colletotrichum falcatum]|nr:hypothetical protein LX36DRAFT_14896 [Colletotrichum falcatum]
MCCDSFECIHSQLTPAGIFKNARRCSAFSLIRPRVGELVTAITISLTAPSIRTTILFVYQQDLYGRRLSRSTTTPSRNLTVGRVTHRSHAPSPTSFPVQTGRRTTVIRFIVPSYSFMGQSPIPHCGMSLGRTSSHNSIITDFGLPTCGSGALSPRTPRQSECQLRQVQPNATWYMQLCTSSNMAICELVTRHV